MFNEGNHFNILFSFLKKKGLARNLSKLLIGSIVLPILFIGIISVTSSYNSIISKSKDGFLSTTHSTGMYMDSIFKNVEQNIFQLITNNVLLDYYSETSTDYAKPVARENAQKMISNVMNTNNLISGIHIITDKETTITYPMDSVSFIYDFNKIKNSNWYKRIESANGRPIWFDNHFEAFDDISIKNGYKIDAYAISVGVSYIDIRTNKKIGVVIFDISEKQLKETLRNIKLSQNGFFLTLTPQDRIISSENTAFKITGQASFINNIKNNISENKNEGAFEAKIGSRALLVCYFHSTFSDLTYIGIVPLSDLLSAANGLRALIIIVSIIFTIIALAIAMYFASKIAFDIEKVTHTISTAASGDLRVNSNVKRNDEIGILSENFNKMTLQLRSLIKKGIDLSTQVNNSIENVSKIANEVSSITNDVSLEIQEIATGAGNQAEEANKILKSVTYFGDRINDVVSASNEMDSLSDEVNNYTNIGLETVKELSKWAEQTSKVTGSMISNINELSGYTKSIGRITNLLNNISEQTKLLALNASIEAAKAGEAGRGFSVVAAEIRKLADQSRNSTKDIEDILNKIIKQTDATQNVADDVENIIKGQEKSVLEVSKSLSNIITAMNKLSDKIEDINKSIHMIDNDKNEIIESIENISSISQETAASSEEVSSAAKEQLSSIGELKTLIDNLNNLAQDLKKAMEIFKV
ncbi:methyl-accepting chemotaxis protein [Caldicellulosiruptoraceae bacterium PP1]